MKQCLHQDSEAATVALKNKTIRTLQPKPKPELFQPILISFPPTRTHSGLWHPGTSCPETIRHPNYMPPDNMPPKTICPKTKCNQNSMPPGDNLPPVSSVDTLPPWDKLPPGDNHMCQSLRFSPEDSVLLFGGQTKILEDRWWLWRTSQFWPPFKGSRWMWCKFWYIWDISALNFVSLSYYSQIFYVNPLLFSKKILINIL